MRTFTELQVRISRSVRVVGMAGREARDEGAQIHRTPVDERFLTARWEQLR